MNRTFKSNKLNVALSAAVVLASAGFSAGSFAAASNTTDLGVSASVVDNCIVVTSPVDFGAYDPFASSAKTGSGSITLTCTNGAEGFVMLGKGLNDSTGTDAAPARHMASGASLLAYSLYTDESLSSPWGNTELTGVSHTGTGTVDAPLIVYGAIPPGQTSVTEGSYVDTVVATVTF